MTNDNQSRRGFIKEAGLVTGAALGTSDLSVYNRRPHRVAAPPLEERPRWSKGARLRAALATGELSRAASCRKHLADAAGRDGRLQGRVPGW